MTRLPQAKILILTLALAVVSSCGSSTPTGVETDDVRGTWSGTFSDFSLMGRTLSGDADWTFTRDEFEIIFFNPPEGQAERIQGDWKFADGKIALELKSSFPIDTDVGATDTLFVSILRDEMSLKTIAESSILLVKTRLAYRSLDSSDVALGRPIIETPHRHRLSHPALNRRSARADIRIQHRTQHTPT